VNGVTIDSATATSRPGHRAVLIGASNLTRGMATALQTVQTIWHPPVEMLVAAGLGRSYGLTSRILGRSLPSILSCGLWESNCSINPSQRIQAGSWLPGGESTRVLSASRLANRFSGEISFQSFPL